MIKYERVLSHSKFNYMFILVQQRRRIKSGPFESSAVTTAVRSWIQHKRFAVGSLKTHSAAVNLCSSCSQGQINMDSLLWDSIVVDQHTGQSERNLVKSSLWFWLWQWKQHNSAKCYKWIERWKVSVAMMVHVLMQWNSCVLKMSSSFPLQPWSSNTIITSLDYLNRLCMVTG